MSVSRVFLDASGSAPMSRRAIDALQAGIADGWADPARIHAESRKARALVDGAREAIAEILDARPELVHFTTSPHHAFERLVGGMYKARRGFEGIAVSAVERDAAVYAAAFAAPHAVDVLPVNEYGHVDLDALQSTVAGGHTALALVQHANQEIGTIQYNDDVYAITHAAGVPLIVDATASIGHIPAPGSWDALVAHPADWGGPGGIGVLALRAHTRWLPAWPEGDDWAPGGVNVPLALASAVALQERADTHADNADRLSGYIDRIRAAVAQYEGVAVVGDPVQRLPHVLTFAFLYLDGEPLLSRLDRAGIAVGSGSACKTNSLEPSRVMEAIGALTHGNVRLGLHPGVTEADIDRFLEILPGIIADVRGDMGAHP
ncbi:MAG: aminotransferase [Actinobacteria bacterium HGW-Actinobacteria-4]|nr:MAG: aminotransferase [Actinobacteria bacterium HGW-Actinobacteria-4]